MKPKPALNSAAGTLRDVERMKRKIAELKRICAESYQVVGWLAYECGIFETSDEVSKALDNLSRQRLVHRDVIPFQPSRARYANCGALRTADGKP